MLGPWGWEHSYFLIILVVTLLPSKEPGPVSLEVHRHLSHVCACEYFSLFHVAVPFLVSTLGAFPEIAPSSSLFCYLTQEEELGLMTAMGMEGSRWRKEVGFI